MFDTTYKFNMYDMPCGVFIDISNYGQTVLFGFALLRNETTATFKWLMKVIYKTFIFPQLSYCEILLDFISQIIFFLCQTFVTVMKKPAKTIIIDQDPWMTGEIATELQFAKHSFCI